MNQKQPLQVSPVFEDPRSRTDFRAKYYPRANAREGPPPDASARNERVMLEFLAVYYELNCQYAALLEERKNSRASAQTRRELELLRAIERTLIARDRLEDRYAPYGVIAEPIIEKGFTIDVIFSFGNVDARGLPRSECLSVTAYVPIPLPPGTQLRDLPVKIEGPGFPSERLT
ncbi:MAG TPA: hypothetical protein VL361_09040 [Candidatus Limnocylindrales bacterium]|nr:hypothetical protein [Candidatus Limnocylindrales bacterium]